MPSLEAAIALLSPYRCLVCGCDDRQLVCSRCQEQLLEPKRATCFSCNRFSRRGQSCSACRRRTHINGVVVASRYAGGMKELLGQLKYQRAQSAGQLLGTLMAPLLSSRHFDLVTAVPPASGRLRERGYNPAEAIAEPLAKLLGVAYKRTLIRRGQGRQVGTNRHTRLRQLQHTMRVIRPAAVAGQRILVVDDVLTTGASVTEAARALKGAGAKNIWGAVAAKHRL